MHPNPRCQGCDRTPQYGLQRNHLDPDLDECQEDFNVAAVVGQLLYLSGHTRPDIAYEQTYRTQFIDKDCSHFLLK